MESMGISVSRKINPEIWFQLLFPAPGHKTCQNFPGSQDHLEIDAKTFAEWGVDYVKMDGCHATSAVRDHGYPEFGRYLNQTGRPMVYSCSWPAYQIGQCWLFNNFSFFITFAKSYGLLY